MEFGITTTGHGELSKHGFQYVPAIEKVLVIIVQRTNCDGPTASLSGSQDEGCATQWL